MTETKTTTTDHHTLAEARKNIWGLFIIGLMATAAGVGIAASQPPETTVDSFGGINKTGSEAAYVFGLGIVAVGYTFILIAVIAWGVSLALKTRP